MGTRYKIIINNILDYCALGLYLYVVLSVFIPIFQTGHKEVFGLVAFLVKVAMICIASLKILMSFKDNLRFSMISSFALFLGFGYYFFKYYTDVNLYVSSGTDLLDLTAAIIAMHGISTQRVFRDYIIVRGTCFAVAVVAANLNIITSRRNYNPKRPGVWDMGMTHHNMPSIIFFFLAIVWISLVKKSKNRLIHYLVILLFAIYLGVVTTSRTSMIVLVMAVFLLAVLYFSEKLNNKFIDSFVPVFGKCVLATPMMVFFVSIGGTIIRNYYIYSGQSIKKGFFHNMISRFYTIGSDFANHGIWLPWSTEKQSLPYNWILGGDISTMFSDNVVQVLVIKYGMVFTALLFGVVQYWAIRAWRNKNYTDLVIIVALCVFSVMEHHVINYMYNPFYFLISTVAADNKRVSTGNDLVVAYNKKTVSLLVGVALIFGVSVICMIPVFKFQIQSGLLHDCFLIWVIFTICLIFAAVKIMDKKNKETKDV